MPTPRPAPRHTPSHAVITVLLLASSASAADFSVHYFEEPRPLTLDPTRIAVFTPNAPSAFGYELVEAHAEHDPAHYTSPVFIDAAGGPMVVPPTIIVRFNDTTTRADARAALAPFGTILDEDYAGLPGAYRIASSRRDGAAVLADANALAERADTRYAEPDMIFTGGNTASCGVPNDPFFDDAWGLRNTGQTVAGTQGLPGFDMDATDAWVFVGRGNPDIITVVIDTGVQQDHPDINQIPGADFTTDPGVNGGPANQCDNHGTPVAGCISGIWNNGRGASGIAPGTRTASARTFVSNIPCNGTWTTQTSATVDALAWAESIGARVTNNSNYYGFTSATIADKYAQTRTNGIVHFASAGNDGDTDISYPASLPTVNAIAAYRNNGQRASFSNYGQGLFASAPGQSIISTDRTGSDGYNSSDHAFVSGTSFASPYAAGVAALTLSRWGLSAEDVEFAIAGSATPIGTPGFSADAGWGLVNAFRAAIANDPQSCTPSDIALPYDALTFADITAFLTLFNCGNPIADLALPHDQYTFADINIFLLGFTFGCN